MPAGRGFRGGWAPPAAAPAVPAWLPVAGEVAALTVANGKLTNNWRDTVSPYFSVPYSIGTVNAYSGAFPNPHWGSFGCTVFFGGGHAGSNDNAVSILEHGADTLTFKRVCDPTPWFSTGTDEPSQIANSIDDANSLMDLDFYEALADGKPGAPHSYGSGDVIGPADGGAACGTFWQVIRSAVNYENDAGIGAAHSLAFANTTDASSARVWVRESENTWAISAVSFGAPCWTVHVPDQGRIYFFGYAANGQPVRWFDIGSGTEHSGSGTTFTWAAGDGPYGAGAFFYVPERQIIVGMWRVSGNLHIKWMDVSVSDPDVAASSVTLSTSVPIPTNWNHGCWCTDNGRIIVGHVSAGNDRVVEIAIPATLTDTWTVETAMFGSGQTIDFEAASSEPCGSFKKWAYNSACKGIVYFREALASGGDTVYAYRPRGT